jgi:hypothetical protein
MDNRRRIIAKVVFPTLLGFGLHAAHEVTVLPYRRNEHSEEELPETPNTCVAHVALSAATNPNPGRLATEHAHLTERVRLEKYDSEGVLQEVVEV